MTLRYTTHRIPGGIHPPERKTLSNTVHIRTAPVPPQLVIPLGQHIGAEAAPIVSVGQSVRRGQCIGQAQGTLSATVHASSSGTVKAIEPRPVQHPSGLPATCVVIDTDGEDRWIDAVPASQERLIDENAPAPEALQSALHAAGIVGLGGAGFPTAVKARPTPKQTMAPNNNTNNTPAIHTLILNAVECEPYITADDLTLRMRSREVLIGCDWLCRISGATTVLIGIEDNKPEAITALQNAVEAYNMEKQTATRFEIVVVPTKYPSGGEKQLVQLLTGQEIPQAGLPASLGLACQNVGTAYACYEALSLNKPLTARITTLTGEAIAEKARGNYDVRIGTPVSALLNRLDTDWAQVDRLIMGGPMMGYTLDSADIPVVKVTNCIIAAPFSELPAPAPEMPCIRCGHCADACPASLLPQQLYWYAKHQDLDALNRYNLPDCIECGACSYVCPSHIPLVQYFRFGKGQIRQHIAETEKSDHARTRFEARQARQAQAQAEREAKRQARAKQTREKQARAKQAPAVPHQEVPDQERPHQERPSQSKRTPENNGAERKSAEQKNNPAQPGQKAPRPDQGIQAKKETSEGASQNASQTISQNTSKASSQNTKATADALKREYLKTEKRYKDLARGLAHLEKHTKDDASDAQKTQLAQHREKVAQLKAQTDALKNQWIAARSSASRVPSQVPSRVNSQQAPAVATDPTKNTTSPENTLEPTALKPNKPPASNTEENL